jgi:hypothetical protein
MLLSGPAQKNTKAAGARFDGLNTNPLADYLAKI